MKVNRSKFDVAKARSCMGRKEILAAGFPDGTLRGVVSGRNLKPGNSRKTCQNHGS